MTKIFLIIVAFTFFVVCGRAYRILCPYPVNSRSHFIVGDALFRGLAAKGHDVTVISPFPPDKPIPNYRHITIELVTNHDELMKTFLKEPGDMGISLDLITTLVRVTIDETNNMLNHPEMQRIMAEENFDLIIMEFLGEPQIGLAAHFNCPVIIFSCVRPTYRLLELMNNPLALSYARHMMLPTADLTHFKDRLLNFVLFGFEKIMMLYNTKKYSAYHDAKFPSSKYPPFHEIFNDNVAALFVADHFSQTDVRPLVPGIIEISGIQMTETASPLPDALQTWMDQSTNGVIFLSLGSNLKVSSLSPERLLAIINVFKKLKQNILWKSDVASIPGLSNNVRLEKWVSQIDVLQHKNIQLFITHGGLGSVTESKFYGVPVLVIPMFADQIPNADVVAAEGWGIKLPYAQFTEQQLTSAIKEVLENSKYSELAKYESMLFRDRPLTPLQTAIYWVEYVIRHKGARHMRSNAAHLNWFQLHSLDVIGCLTAVFIVWAYISYKILKCLVKKCFGNKKSKLKQN